MKKIISTTLALSLIPFAVACGDDGSSGENGGAGGTGSAGESSGGAGGEANGTGGGGGSTGGSAGDSGSGGSIQGPTGDCAWEVTYDLTGQLAIEDTTGGFGDVTNDLSGGTLVLRLSDDGDAIAAGPGVVLSYALPQMFVVDTFGTVVTTDVEATVVGGDCGTGEATLAIGDSDPTLAFSDCPNGRPESGDTTGWGPSDSQSGEPGCWNDYNSLGNVTCTGTFCGAGGLDPLPENNPQDETWDQSMSELVFAADFSTFTMAKTPVPNDAESSTYLTLAGTETSRECKPIPASCQ